MTELGKLFERLFSALRPTLDNDPMVQYNWRWTIAVTLFAVVLIGSFSLAWAQGFVPGLSGVATKADVEALSATFAAKLYWQNKRIEAKIKRIDDRQLLGETLAMEQAIRLQRTNECEAENPAKPNVLAAQLAEDTLGRYLDDYFRLTGHAYPNLPDCRELVLAR